MPRTTDPTVRIRRDLVQMLDTMSADLKSRNVGASRAEIANMLLSQHLNGEVYARHVMIDVLGTALAQAEAIATVLGKDKARQDGEEHWVLEKRLEILTGRDGSKTVRKTFSYVTDTSDIKEEIWSISIPAGAAALAAAIHDQHPDYQVHSTTDEDLLKVLNEKQLVQKGV